MSEYKRIRAVTLPTLSFKDNGTRHVRITGPIHEGKKMPNAKPTDKPADLCAVIDLDTGEEAMLIVPAIVKEVLHEQYKDGGYIDHCFAIKFLRQKEDKRYKEYSVHEIEDPAKAVKKAASK